MTTDKGLKILPNLNHSHLLACLAVFLLAASAPCYGADGGEGKVLASDDVTPNSHESDEVSSNMSSISQDGSESSGGYHTRLAAHPWAPYTLGFRQGHNVSADLGGGRTRFRIKSFGAIKNQSFWLTQARTSVRYYYNIQISGKLGYQLGSTFGFETYADGSEDFEIVDPVVIFPGLLMGLVWETSPVLRFYLQATTNLERYENFRENHDPLPSESADERGKTEISVTMYSISQRFTIEYFFDLYMALSVSLERKDIFYERPNEPRNFDVNASFHGVGMMVNAGIVYHVL